MKQILIALSLIVMGCYSQLKIVNSDGSVSYQLSCRRNVNDCLEDAKIVCNGKEFKVISTVITPGSRRESLTNTYTIVANCQ